MKQDLPIILTPMEAAKLLHLSVSTLAKMRLDGRGPRYVKLGHRVAYRQGDLLEWLEGNSFKSTSEYVFRERTAISADATLIRPS